MSRKMKHGMRRCPFCKRPVSHPEDPIFGVRYNNLIGRWLFSHECRIRPIDVSIVVYGDSKEEVIDKWNGVHEKQESKSV